MKVTPNNTKVTKEGYIKSKISAIMKTIIVRYIKILNMLDFLFSESTADIWKSRKYPSSAWIIPGWTAAGGCTDRRYPGTDDGDGKPY